MLSVQPQTFRVGGLAFGVDGRQYQSESRSADSNQPPISLAWQG